MSPILSKARGSDRWWTTSRTGAPGRIVIVGWICRLREVSWSPARETFCWVDWRIAWTRSLSPLNAKFGADAEQRRERHALEQRPGVEIDLVRKPGIAGRIGRRHIVDAQRTAVGHDDPLPDDQRAASGRTRRRCRSCRSAARLGGSADAPGGAVVDALGDLRRDQPGKIGAQPGDQAGRDHAARRQRIGRRRWRQRVRIDVARAGRAAAGSPSCAAWAFGSRSGSSGELCRSSRRMIGADGRGGGRRLPRPGCSTATMQPGFARRLAARPAGARASAAAACAGGSPRHADGVCGRHAAALLLEDRPAEIARQRRPELRRVAIACGSAPSASVGGFAARDARSSHRRRPERRRLERDPGRRRRLTEATSAAMRDDHAAPEPDGAARARRAAPAFRDRPCGGRRRRGHRLRRS